MKNITKGIISKFCIWIGVSLLILGLLALTYWQSSIYFSAQKSKAYLQTLRTVIPSSQGAVPEQRSDNSMAIFSIEQTDFVGILEMPRYESALPVCADWGNSSKYPCRFDGSVYNGTMQIGATSQKGQYDFYREISVGDILFFTDMEGNRYTYSVTNLCYEKKADSAILKKESSALTLFVKNLYDFEYLIISCNTLK
jgi:sortase (surface protein transpeptidase)